MQLEAESMMTAATITASDQLKLMSFGINIAESKKRTINLEKEKVLLERSLGLVDDKVAEKRLLDLNKRYVSAGEELWDHVKQKTRLEDPGMKICVNPDGSGISESLVALYREEDCLSKVERKSLPDRWCKDAEKYYDVIGFDLSSPKTPKRKNNTTWCHAAGKFVQAAKPTEIIPCFLEIENITKMVFSSKAESLLGPKNCLLLSTQISRWFYNHHCVVVPVDVAERPIRRWKMEVASLKIETEYARPDLRGKDLHGRELSFRNENRPAAHFLYFHFIMALARMRDLERRGWEQVWAKYYHTRPFPTPAPYMRKEMLRAIATYFKPTDVRIVESWVQDNGFQSVPRLREAESAEVARRFNEAVIYAVRRSERTSDKYYYSGYDSEIESGGGSESESESE